MEREPTQAYHQTAPALFTRGRAAYDEGRRKHARQLFRDAQKAWQHHDREPLRAAIHVELGRTARDLDDAQSAVSHYRTAAELYRGLGDSINLAHALRHGADILREMNLLEDAEPFILEAIALYRAERPLPQLHLANALRVAALLKEQAGSDAEEALPLWVEARDLYREVGVDAGVAESRAHLAAARSA
jgi:tetratricopeptide (TPR) repeat protein